MIELRPITLADKAWVDELVFAENSRSADYNFGNIYIWNKRFRRQVGRLNDRVITKLRYEGKSCFVFPIGEGELRPVMDELRRYAERKNYSPFTLCGVTEKHKDQLEELYPGAFEYEETEDGEDYIYDIEKLSTYAGKALHGKKNHCNRFEKEHEWHFEPLTRALIPDCLDMLEVWTEENAERLDESISYEHDAIVRAFASFECLGLEGGVLFADGRIVGFTLGEMAGSDTFDVHFEKAETAMNGAYPMVCRELCRMLAEKHPELKYINREEDMGLESLRTSKLSYKPEYRLKKYTARWKSDEA